MALSEAIEYDRIEVTGKYKTVQVREATIISKDGKELTKSFHRYVLHPGTLDASDNLVDTDLSDQPAEVSSVASAAWTQSIKDSYKTFLISQKGS